MGKQRRPRTPPDSGKAPARVEAADPLFEVFGRDVIVTQPGGIPTSARVIFGDAPAPPDQEGRPRIVEMVTEMIEARARVYAEQGDTLRAWEAYWLAHTYGPMGVAMPGWVTSYLERVARRLIAISRGEPKAAKLAAALELAGRGRGAIFARRKIVRQDHQLALDVAALIRKGHKAYKAIDYVAEVHKVSRSTVDRAYSRVKSTGIVTAGGWETSPRPSKKPA